MERYNDEELLYLIQCHNDDAKKYLFDIYRWRIMQWMKPFSKYQYLGIEMEDFIQIAMINFWNAILSYRNDLEASLSTYVKMVILRRTYSEIAMKKEKRLLDGKKLVSFDEYVGDENGYVYGEIIEDPTIKFHPQKLFEIRETTSQYLTHFKSKASIVEKDVMAYMLLGYEEKEIAKKLNIPLKSVYNAAYRGHKKVNH